MSTIHISVDQLDHSASQAQARDHALILDRPEAKGGQNKGPMGGEAMLMGLAGCFMSNLLAAAAARDIELRNVKAEIAAELADAPARFSDIHMKVTGDRPSLDEFEKLIRLADRGCICANTLRQAVNLTIECA